jgi:hypothetical protein
MVNQYLVAYPSSLAEVQCITVVRGQAFQLNDHLATLVCHLHAPQRAMPPAARAVFELLRAALPAVEIPSGRSPSPRMRLLQVLYPLLCG